MSRATRQPHCCPGCGRDTFAAFCPSCTGGVLGSRRNRDGERGRRRNPARWPEDVFDEDRYDEESGPNDVFDDGNLSLVGGQLNEVVQP